MHNGKPKIIFKTIEKCLSLPPLACQLNVEWASSSEFCITNDAHRQNYYLFTSAKQFVFRFLMIISFFMTGTAERSAV
jgi:hypothetical protein